MISSNENTWNKERIDVNNSHEVLPSKSLSSQPRNILATSEKKTRNRTNKPVWRILKKWSEAPPPVQVIKFKGAKV